MGLARSAEFQQLVRSLDEPPAGRARLEGLDNRLLLAVRGEERTAVEDLLIARLAPYRDWRVPGALVELDCRRAVPALRTALAASPRPRGALVAALARALKRLGGGAAGLTPLLDELRAGRDWHDRSAAAAALGQFAGADVEAALTGALDDGDGLVRANALTSLLAIRGLEALAGSRYGTVGMWRARLVSDVASVHRDAARDIAQALAALAGGKSPGELGIDHVVNAEAPWVVRLIDSAIGTGELAVDAIDQATGRDREWAENALLALAGRDPRAISALAHLDSERARAALVELGQRDS